MEGPGNWHSGRGTAFAAVLLLHVGMVMVLTVDLRTQTKPHSADFISTMILLAAPQSPVPSRDVQGRYSRRRVAPLELPKIGPPELSVSGDTGTTIDWTAEAQRAARTVTGASTYHVFGASPSTDFGRGPRLPLPQHAAGEQERTENGKWIVWVSDRCYITSDVPPLGLPDVLARSIPSRTVCQSESGHSGDLFVSLLAYKRYRSK